MTPITGVYQIKNTKSGKVYVGSAAVSLSKRWNVHKCRLRKKTHHSKKLQNAWEKHGEEAFEFSVLEHCPPTQCEVLEQKWIDLLDSFNAGYNCRPNANSQLGHKHSPETIALIKERQKATGWRPTLEQRTRSANSRRGLKKSEEAKRKLSIAKKGKPGRVWTEEEKNKVSKALSGRKRPQVGKLLSKPVRGISVETGQVLNFHSTREATEYGFTSGAVSRACRKTSDYPNGIHKGFRWEYANNP